MDIVRKYSIEGIVASILFLLLISVVLLQVFGRVGIFVGPVWTEELARWIWVWMAFVAIGEVERTNSQLRMGIFSDRLPKSFKKYLFILVDAVYLGITCHLCWIGFKTIRRTWYNEAVTLPLSDAFLYASYFVASVFIIWRLVYRIQSKVTRRSSEKGMS